MEELNQNKCITLQNASTLNSEEFSLIVDGMARDMKFYSLFYTIYGIFISLTVFGAVLGIPLIIYNLKLKDSADQFRRFTQSKDFLQLRQALVNQKKFFFFNKVLIILTLVILVLYTFLLIYLGFSFSSNAGDFLQI